MGSVRHPRVTLVSTPNVPDTEKLSWIVLGRKPDPGGLDTSVLLAAAGSILGGQSGGGITEQITKALGIDEISFKQAGIGSSLSGQIGVVGKRISSRVYLSYERSLTTATMGITGFDSPVAFLSIQETNNSLEGIQQYFAVFCKKTKSKTKKNLPKSLFLINFGFI